MPPLIKPYEIKISDVKLNRLQQKLALTDFSSLDDLKPTHGIKAHLSMKSKVEARLNKLPQFITSIDISNLGAFDVHFVYKKITQPNAIPLLFLHGWPGSFYEVSRIVDALAEGDGNGAPSFHVVAPSLIDFGFSSASKAFNSSTTP
ncbi:putative epoxide hydrolase [Fusarium austroafricanum]|uniref:Putative epoxide hydrolase n=1 Tax=Fusarium austroafricanum TaxID=2364996 RepID=A0A8H4N8R8_9HYPO|nr:putative epoxide hydrolase [Fusarium austroafricanum]